MKKHKIEIAVDHHEGSKFVAWLNKNGHDAGLGSSTGNYVDGEWTSSDEDANQILNKLWDKYCNGSAAALGSIKSDKKAASSRENGKEENKMKKLTAKEYYASEQDYYLDSQNVADCKFQHTIDNEATLYAISENEDQFFIATVGDDDVFYVGITPKEFLSRRKSAAALGAIKSDKKAASSRENGKKGGRPKELEIGKEKYIKLDGKTYHGIITEIRDYQFAIKTNTGAILWFTK